MEVKLKNENCSANIISAGAELKSLMVGGRELMWCADPAFWGKTSPLLFPMIGTLKNGKTIINGEEYAISRHGFARDLEWVPESVSGTSATFSLSENEKTLKMYPFAFRFSVTYTLKSDGLTVTYRVRNNNSKDMPFCIGGHPAFACGGDFKDYRLEFAKPETASVPNYNLTTGMFEDGNRRTVIENSTTLPLDHELFSADVLYFDLLQSRSVSLLNKENRGLRVDFHDFTSLGVWQALNAPFLCIEPWCGSADFDNCTGIFAEKRGAVIIKPNEERSFTYAITAI